MITIIDNHNPVITVIHMQTNRIQNSKNGYKIFGGKVKEHFPFVFITTPMKLKDKPK